MSDKKESEAGEKEESGGGDPTKALISAIQSQHKALFIAGMTLLLFWLAPRSNELLRAGRQELDAQTASKHMKEMRDRVQSAPVGKSARDRLAKTLRESNFDTAKFDKAVVAASPDPEGPALLSAVGVTMPETLGDYARLASGESFYCSPRMEPRVMAGLQPLGSQSGHFTLESLSLYAVHDVDSLAAAKAVLARALKIADELPEKVDAGAPSKGSAALFTVLGQPPQKLTYWDGNTQREKDNPAFAAYQRQQAELAKIGEEAAKATKKREDAALALKEHVRSLRNEMIELDRSTHMQLGAQSEAPRFLVARLNVERVLAEDNVPTDSLAVPVPCELTTLALDGATPLAPSLVGTPEWKELRDMRPDRARQQLDEMLRAKGETIEIAGFKVHENELTKFGPLLLGGLWLWHLFHLFRLRNIHEKVAEQSASALLPTFPARQNFPLPFVIMTITLVVMGFFFFGHGERDLVTKASAIACSLLATASFVWTLRSAPRLNVAEIGIIPDLNPSPGSLLRGARAEAAPERHTAPRRLRGRRAALQNITGEIENDALGFSSGDHGFPMNSACSTDTQNAIALMDRGSTTR